MDLAQLLVFTAPVAIAAIGECVNQRTGTLNIGLEGTMLAAAYFGMLTSLHTGSPWIGILVGMVVGTAFSALQAYFVLKLAADQVVVGTAINLFALGLTSTLFRTEFGSSGLLLSVPQIPKFWGVDIVVVAMVSFAFGAAWTLRRTKLGLALRAAGEFPEAVATSGFSVLKLRFGAMLVGGALGGLAGAYLSLGISGSFAENMTAGRGFVAIAMVTFGRWKPIWVLAASMLVGYAVSLQFVFQSKGWNIPFQLLSAAPYVFALLVLVGAGRGSASPAALGKSFRSDR